MLGVGPAAVSLLQGSQILRAMRLQASNLPQAFYAFHLPLTRARECGDCTLLHVPERLAGECNVLLSNWS